MGVSIISAGIVCVTIGAGTVCITTSAGTVCVAVVKGVHFKVVGIRATRGGIVEIGVDGVKVLDTSTVRVKGPHFVGHVRARVSVGVVGVTPSVIVRGVKPAYFSVL